MSKGREIADAIAISAIAYVVLFAIHHNLLAIFDMTARTAVFFIYPVQAIIRNLFGSMTLKLSVMAQQNFGQFRGTFSHRNSRVTSANCAHVA